MVLNHLMFFQIEVMDVVVYLTPEGAFLNNRVMQLPVSVGALAISRIGTYIQVTGLDGELKNGGIKSDVLGLYVITYLVLIS